jgi:predicted lipoprotein with Yx(FWY)xxD motif
MSRFTILTVAAVVAPLLAACVTGGDNVAAVAPLKTMETSIGTVLADQKGYTLYTYKNDPTGRSECAGRCARKWPPVMVNGEMPAPGGDLSVIERKDGSRQFAWRGRPLYRWEKDKEPGQVTGHNLGEVWFVARP